jgi:hypothetical protein
VAVTGTVDADAQRTYGITQAVVAAFATTPTEAPGRAAVDCWEAAFAIIQQRLPGSAERFGHGYRPTATPDAQQDLEVAMATLALATISQPMRADLRQILLAAALLITCRPAIGQAALVHVLRAGLGAGRAAWLLDIVRVCLSAGQLIQPMAAELVRLAETDWLSVRALAGHILDAHGLSAPSPPATEPAWQIRAAFRDLFKDHG